MSIYLPSTGGKEPFWGPQTSHMNFCEEDYHVTIYMGEFINTITSLFYTYLGIYGVLAVWSRRERSLFSFLPSISVIILGIGSALYHASLKYPMQLLDDNSMLFGAAVILHRLLARNTSKNQSMLIGVAVAAGVCAAIYAHIQLGESTFHQIFFASMMLTSAYKTGSLISSTINDKTAKRQMSAAGIIALTLFISGYILWNIDNQACDHLRSFRHSIGLPWAWLFELHGWWHVLTGLGVYIHAEMVECLCHVGPGPGLPLDQRVPAAAYAWIKSDSKKE